MALNSSGPISLAGTTAGQSIELENGGNGTTQISLNDTAVRTLAGVPSGAITMPTNFWGKSNNTYWAIFRGNLTTPAPGFSSTPDTWATIANTSGRAIHQFNYNNGGTTTSALWYTKNDGTTIASYRTDNNTTNPIKPLNGMLNYSATVIPYTDQNGYVGALTITDSTVSVSTRVATSISLTPTYPVGFTVGTDDNLYGYFQGQNKSSQYAVFAKIVPNGTRVAYRNPYSRNNTNTSKYVALRTDNSYLYGLPVDTNIDIIYNVTSSNYAGIRTTTDSGKTPMGIWVDSSNNIYIAFTDNAAFSYVRKYNSSWTNTVAMRYNKSYTQSVYATPFMLAYGNYLYLFGDVSGVIQITAINIADLSVAWGLQINAGTGYRVLNQDARYSTGTATPQGLFFSITDSTYTYDFKIPLNGQLSNSVTVNSKTFTPSTMSVTTASQSLVNATDGGQGTAGATISTVTATASTITSITTPAVFKITTGWT